MQHKLLFLFFPIATCLMVFFTTCKKCPEFLSYKIPITLVPAQDSFNIGDTIWIEINLPDKITDENGGIENIFSNFDFRIELACELLDSVPSLAQTTNYLGLHTLVGQDSVVALSGAYLQFYQIIPDYISQSYRYKCALTTRQKGQFVLFIAPFDHQTEPFEFSGKCDRVALHFTSRLNNDDDNNFEDFKKRQHPSYSAWNIERFHNNGGFYFVVR